MKASISALLCALVMLSAFPNAAHAWRVDTCNGKVKGMQTNRTFTIDTCNIPILSDRYNAVIDAVGAWNAIHGVAERFKLVTKNHGCKIKDDDTIAFVDPRTIPGKAGLTKYMERPCGVLPNNDGRRFDIRILIASNLSMKPSNPRSRHQSVRQVLFHEMGHALGAKHDTKTSTPNMMQDPNNLPRLADRDKDGRQKQGADALLPNDIEFALRWHKDGKSAAYDMAAGGQRYDHANNVPLNLNGTATVDICPGGSGNVNISHWVTGGRAFSCNVSDESKLKGWIVLSDQGRISTLDTRVSEWKLCGKPGQRFINNAKFTVPWGTTPGLYNVGWIIDPLNRYPESNENNNAIDLGMNVRVLSCWGGGITWPWF